MLISVVIPVFNRSDCVCRAVSSALQLATNLAEVVVVDDASTDGSAQAVCAAFSDEIERGKVLLVSLKTNSGATAAKNAGASRCSGEWIMFLDSDDLLLEGSVDSVVATLKAADSPSVVFFRCIDSMGRLIGAAPVQAATVTCTEYLRAWRWGECLPVVRARDFIAFKYDADLRGFEGLLYARLLKSAGPALIAPIVARMYETEREDRISSGRGKFSRSCLLSRGYVRILVEFSRQLGFEGCLLACIKIVYFGFFCVGFRTFRALYALRAALLSRAVRRR